MGETRGRQESRPATARNFASEEVQARRQHTMSDVDMELVGTCEYDPDDLDLKETPVRMANATMRQGLDIVPRIKLSAILDLKELMVET